MISPENDMKSDMKIDGELKTVKVDFEEGIAWVTWNRPEKRNAFSPALNREMMIVLDALELDERCGVVVLTGAGEAFSAGMDLKEFFRASDGLPPIAQARVKREATDWMWRKLMHYVKPTIAMVNGWCFGGAFTPLVSCDLAIASEEAVFGLSEINWGIVPAGNVTRAIGAMLNRRDALYYIMTGENFDGRKAAAMGLVNEAVPKAQLLDRTRALARTLLGKNPVALNAAKLAFKFSQEMPWDAAEDYLLAKQQQAIAMDPEKGRDKGMKQFLDEKKFRPGLENYKRES